MPTSFCTTSSLNLRPIRRFTANSVFFGLVTAWRLADWPTTTSLSLVKATIDGVVRSPSLFSITRDLPASMTATQELVVPRSIPMTLPMCVPFRIPLKNSLCANLVPLFPASRGIRRAGHDDARGTQQATVQFVAPLHHLQHRIRLGGVGGVHRHRVVPLRVEGLAQRVDLVDGELLEGALQQAQRGFLAGGQAGCIAVAGGGGGHLQAVGHGKQFLGEALQRKTLGLSHVTGSALAD